jgi:hypothetical protein
VSSAVGQPIEDVRGMQDESNRWAAVEDDLRTLLKAAHAVLVPHVREIKRLKKIERRKKTASDVPPPETPAPVP